MIWITVFFGIAVIAILFLLASIVSKLHYIEWLVTCIKARLDSEVW